MNSNKMTETNTTNPVITQDALAHLGDGRLAYVKAIRSEDVPHLFPQVPKIAPGIQLFALHGASRIVAMSFCEPRSCRLQLSS